MISSVVAHAQYSVVPNGDNTLTITGYSGAGGAVVIPGTISGMTVTVIAAGVFIEAGLTSVSIPASVTIIGAVAFQDNPGLTNVSISENVTNIGAEAFSDCTNLTAINVSGQNAFYSSLNGVLFDKNADTLLEFPPGLGPTYTIPNSVTNVGDEAFSQCDDLTDVAIPKSVLTIGQSSFYGCSGLTNVTVAAGVTNIGFAAFVQCTNLVSVYFSGNAPAAVGCVFCSDPVTIYYLPGANGWELDFAGRPAVLQGGLQVEIPASEYNALVDLYNSTSGSNWTLKSGWLDAEADSWFGVVVTAGHVSVIGLGDNQLSGSIPASLTNLPYLQEIGLDGNELTGTIPTNLASFSQLVSLDLGNNQFSGSVPASLGNLSQLLFLNLSSNHLSGGIPSNLANLSQLQFLNFDQNQLSGSIPDGLGELVQLQELEINSNQLSGSLPASLGNLSQLEVLDLQSNQLTGSIPTNLAGLSQLQDLLLDMNQLEGSIPTNLANLSQLQVLDLASNQLTGSIPTNLGDLSQLVYLGLGSNRLTGSIPGVLTNLSQLSFLGLSMNQLTGDVPDFRALRDGFLDLASNNLTITGGSASITNIITMLEAGNEVIYSPQSGIPVSVQPALLVSNPGLEFGLAGFAGLSYTIEASSDLTTWTNLTNITLTSGSGGFLDPSATNYSHRFYRAFVNP
jgi:Leucine-rich repeat (LRR) protein